MRSVVIALDAVRHRNIFRHEDVRLKAGSGGISREGSGGISRGRNRELLQSEVSSHGDASRKAARLERSRRIQPLVFDVNVGIFAAGKHGREAFAQRNRIGLGQNGVIAPHGGRSPSEARGRKRPLNRGEVVTRVENAAVFRTNCLGPVGGIMFAAASAFQVSQHAMRV